MEPYQDGDEVRESTEHYASSIDEYSKRTGSWS